ncbi:MAG: type II toxin-antitoxin system HicB family antitoxin [Spirochaetaceae bacterium]|nr:type II toxin-antitoxin system HicB family antitoxin [Spirochaetaceae bacterium]MBR2362240.1 type II toxin-antitoxin system HicB family antitoxin [Spirochaetaceae bacterium]
MKKNLPERYCYPAVFTYEDGQEIAVVFPDLELATSGKDDADALFSARDALGGRLELMEEDGEPIPSPSRIADIQVDSNERVCLVDVYMPSIRMAGESRAVKRTVTLPAWMNAKAMELGINFSQVLQESLKTRISAAGGLN